MLSLLTPHCITISAGRHIQITLPHAGTALGLLWDSAAEAQKHERSKQKSRKHTTIASRVVVSNESVWFAPQHRRRGVSKLKFCVESISGLSCGQFLVHGPKIDCQLW